MTEPEILIRRMTRADAAQAAAIERLCFSEPWSQEAFEATLLLPYAAYYVAEAAGEASGQTADCRRKATSETSNGSIAGRTSAHLVGLCGVRKIMGEGEITNVAVLPSCRRRGVARRLLERLLAEAADEGVRDFTLEVRSGNAAAIRLYTSLGFRQEGRRSRFYRHPEEDALLFWLRDFGER